MGRRPPCSGDDHHKEDGTMKKGAWTAEEDEKLLGFIKKNKGHGSWRTLPKLAGLERCGKSCRLRWANYLRPNIKRGNFSAEEEGIIVQFHAVMGNKWSTIASHLPGRTDNEVKNHWNTHLKKRLTRMGIDPTTHLPFNLLPVPPRHLHNDASTIADWQQALLQHSLQVNSTIARHLVQWELARLEAEARQQLASSDDYYASWLQKLYRKQSPVYDLHALLTVENLQTELVTSQPITTVSSYTQSHGSQTSDTKHLENTPRPLSGGDDMSLNMNNVENIERASFSNEESELLQEQCVLTSASGGSTGALDTCSSSDSLPSHLSSSQFDVPDDFLALDLSSDDSYDPDIIADPLENSSLSLDDIPAGQQDSYWSRMLNFLDHASLENL